MVMMTCERCGKQSPKLEKCNYCGRLVCRDCTKSSKRLKVGRLFICKDCWSDMKKRKEYKSVNS